MEEEEVWRPITGYEGLYEISSFGRVKSLERFVRRGKVGGMLTKGKILSTCKDASGYLACGLSKKGITQIIRIHKIVAIQFLGHVPSGFALVIDHINGNKEDNRVNNLRVVTNRFNTSFGRRRNYNFYSSKHVGVFYNNARKKWQASIYIGGKTKNLGSFVNELDAANAYNKELLIINKNIQNYAKK